MSPGGGAAPPERPARRRPGQEKRRRPNDRPFPIPAASQQVGGIADGGRQADPLDGPPGHPGQPLQHRQQMPAAVVTGEGVHLVDDDRPQVGEQAAVLDLEADQHRFQRLRRGQQHVRRFPQDPLPRRRGDVAVPDRDPASQPPRVGFQPGQQVVQQRLERADVDDRDARPALRVHRGQQREDRGLGLAARRRRQEQGVRAVQHRAGGLVLQRSQRPPAQGVDDVVHDDRVQPVQRRAHRDDHQDHGRSRSMSSARAADGTARAAALRSTSDSSPAARVSA